MEKWTYNYAHDCEKILDAALNTFGLDRRFLFTLLGIPFDPNKKWDGQNIGAGEWFVLCHSLGLSADSVTYGYSYQEHLAKVRYMLDNGILLSLPQTPKVRELIRRAKIENRREARFRWKHYGFRLCLKMEFQDFRKKLRRSVPSAVSNHPYLLSDEL